MQSSHSQAEAKPEKLTSMEKQHISGDDDWNPSIVFAFTLTEITEQLNRSADVNKLKSFLKFLCHPHTCQRYIDVDLYKHCKTPGEIIEALFPQYINYMHTDILRMIVNNFGNKKSQTLLKKYEDNFPCKRPLKRMRDPIPDDNYPGSKRVNVKCGLGASIETTNKEDVDRVRQTISRNTGIDKSVIVYAKQTPGSVIFTFLIPETMITGLTPRLLCGGREQKEPGAHSLCMLSFSSCAGSVT